ncbi:MAG: hydantoinase/oxoprolinase family protein [Chloroflexi bacterium]|nr:hydantoinase/oxoprolinase family protein [Chloroflexota bacterium]
MTRFRAAVDIGGTFTDVVFLGDDGRVLVKKLASTPDDYSRGVLVGLDDSIQTLGIKPGDVTELGHGFTVATNAILEGKGAKTALVTTEGFRDVLELGRIRTPRLYDLYYRKPPPLVERRLRFEVRERMSFKGEVLEPLDLSDVERVADRIAEEGVKSVAISLLHSYANPDHESRIAEVIAKRVPGVDLSVSSQVLPEMREYERTSTTVINAYVRPVVARYLTGLEEGLRARGITVPLTIMQSNGGLAPVHVTVDRPIFCIESGPAAGVVGAYHLGKRIDTPDIISFDMGGTTAKASIIEGGEILRAPEYEVGGGMSVGHRLLTGGGYVLRVPTIDLAEVSAGGGSIAWVDKAGALQCGPQSAGAVPGPACYDAGGEEPTVTDANVALGYLNPEYLLGGSFPINAEKARRAIADRVAGPLGLSDINAAHGIHLLVNSNMGRALRAVSSERGRDPRRFTLVAFGGGGPIHAAGLAKMLGISRVVIPPSPGAFSAFGLLFADIEHHFVQTYFRQFSELDLEAVNGILQGLKDQGTDLLRDEGFEDSRQETTTQVDMKYVGQTSELTVGMEDDRFSAESLKRLSEAHAVEHDKTYGYRVDEPLQLVSIRVIARGIAEGQRVPEDIDLSLQGSGPVTDRRNVYFGPEAGWVDTPIMGRMELDGAGAEGPLVVEEYDSTVVVPPGWRASLDSLKDIVLDSTGG